MSDEATYKQKLEVLREQQELIEDEAEQEEVSVSLSIMVFILMVWPRRSRRHVRRRRKRWRLPSGNWWKRKPRRPEGWSSLLLWRTMRE